MEKNELKRIIECMIDAWDNSDAGESIAALTDRIFNVIEVHTGTHDKFITIRGTLGRLTRDMGDSEKLIKAEVSVYNTRDNMVAFAMLGGAAVNIIGVQADIEARIGTVRAPEGKDDSMIVVQTDLEEHCDEQAKKRAELEEKLAAMLPTPEQIEEFAARSSWEEWWVDADVANDLDEAKLQGAYAFEKGAAHGANPYDSNSQCKLYEAWALAHYEVESAKKALEDFGHPEVWPGDDEAEPSTVPVMSPWASKTKAELKAELERRGVELPRHPTKPELVEALEKAIAEAGPSEDVTDGEPGGEEGVEEDAEKEAAVA